MEKSEEEKAQLKKLNSRATTLKMDLHDLAEELPTNWEQILKVADETYAAYKNLTEYKKELAAKE